MNSQKPAPEMPASPVIIKANKLLNAGNSASAHKLLRSYCKKNKNDLQGWYLFSVASGQLGRFEDVIKACNHILKQQPQHPVAQTNLANALAATGKHDQAIEHYEQALQSQPKNASILGNYGFALYLAGHYERSIPILKQVAQTMPENAEVQFNLASACDKTGDAAPAIKLYKRTIELKPDWFEPRLKLADCLRETGQLNEAEDTYHAAIKLLPESKEAHRGLAITKRFAGDLQGAMEIFQKTLDMHPGDIEILSGIADVKERMGYKEEAYQLIKKILSSKYIPLTAAAVYLRICQKYGSCDEALTVSKKLFDAMGPNDINSATSLHYSTGKSLDSLGRYDEAFQHFTKANKLLKKTFNFDTLKQRTDSLIEVFNPTFIKENSRSSDDSKPLVFIVGMPRSGTSLVEQILSSHPQVFGAGELDNVMRIVLEIKRRSSSSDTYPHIIREVGNELLDEYAESYIDDLRSMANDEQRITDKMPHNFMNLGLIALLFPNAHIIHCRRHPLDTCLSIFSQSFNLSHDYSTDLHNLGLFHNEYMRLMDYWKSSLPIPIIDVVYEELIENQELISRKMIEFIGLDWDDSCLDFHKTERVVATASYDQVRRPIYKKSVARWKHYEKHLDALKNALSDDPINWPP